MNARALPLPLSARTSSGLSALAAAWVGWLRGEGAAAPLPGLCRTAALGRSVGRVRACPVGHSHEELATACEILARRGHEVRMDGVRWLTLGAVAEPVKALALVNDELVFAEAAIAASAPYPGVRALLAGEPSIAPDENEARVVASAALEALLATWSPADNGEPLAVDMPAIRSEHTRTVLLHRVVAGWCAGAALNWEALLPAGIPRAPAPLTPWQRTAFPFPGREAERAADASADNERAGRPADVDQPTPLAWVLSVLARVTEGQPREDATLGELGVDSLMALEISDLARIERGAAIPLRALAPDATPAEVASALEGARDCPPTARESIPLGDDESQHEPFALTDVQRAYWLGRQDDYALGGVACHWYAEWEVPPDFDVVGFEQAVDTLVERHPMLRAVVGSDGRQVVLEDPGSFHVRRDLTHPDELERALSHRVADPTKWPLFCAALTEPVGGSRHLAFSFDLLIADGAALIQFGRELDALLRGHPLDPPPALTFRDYQEAERAAPPSAAARGYWLSRAPQLPDPPQLPLSLSPEEVRPTRFKRERATLRPPQWSRLQERATREGLTPSMLLCAAFAETLALHAKDPSFLLNVTTYHRRALHSDVSHVLGDFTSLTLLEVDAGSADPFRLRARRLQDRLWEDLDHRAFSGIAVLRERARTATGPQGAPIVYTSLLGQTTGRRAPFSVLGEPIQQLSQTPQVWLDHQVMDREGALELTFDHVVDLFPEGFISAMVGCHLALLTRLADDPEAWSLSRPAQLPESATVERDAANDTFVARSPGLLHTPLLSEASNRPRADAVITAEGTVSFGKLDARSAGTARWITEHGIAPGRLVAIVMHKCPAQAIAALGTLRAGAAYLPVDAGLPGDRIRLLLKEGEVGAILTTSALAPQLPAELPRLCVDQVGAGEDPGPCPARPDDLAYVIFTSGSTGTPKGVMIEHGAARNTVLDCNERFSVGRGDRVMGVSSLSFDLSVWDVFGVPGAGGAVVLPDGEGLPDPAGWVRLVESAGVTIWNSVPAIAGLLEEHLAVRDRPLPSSLRLFMLSGDWIPLGLPERLRAWAGERPLDVVSLGGATEASIWSIAHPIDRVKEGWNSIPYGRPLANQTVHVLDAELRERPDWVPGDLYIGGVGLARGYWRDHKKTARGFIRGKNAERLYRTGDLARWRPGGLVEFLGREDGQVKIHGYRVELGEVESAIASHPAVGDAVARLWERRLVGYVVPSESGSVDLEAVREHIRERLPSYMVPALLQAIEEIPLTSNGKVDRKALPDPSARSDDLAGDLDALVAEVDSPDGRPLEGLPDSLSALVARLPQQSKPEDVAAALITRRLRAQLARAMHVGAEAIGADDTFASQGIDSLSAIELRGEVQARFGVTLPLSRFAGANSVRTIADDLTRSIAERAGNSADLLAMAACLRAAAEVPQLTPDEDPYEPFPLTDVQQAYWVGRDASFPLGGVACHLYAEWEGSGVDPERLETALQRLVERHPMLSAVVEPDGRQRILDRPVRAEVRIGEGTATLADWRSELDHEVRDPRRAPLWEVRMVRLGGDTWRTLVSFDLLVADGLSLTRIGTELDALYEDPDAQLPAIDVTFRQAVLRPVDAASRAAAEAYWAERAPTLPGGPRLPLTCAPRDLETLRFQRLQHEVDPASWRALQRRAAERNLSPSAVLCAAYAEALSTHAGDPNFTLAVTTGDRPPINPGIGLVVGDFTSVTPLVVQAAGGGTFSSAAGRLQARLWNDLEHREVSAVAIARERAKATGRTPEGWPVVFTSILSHVAAQGEPDPFHRFGRMVHAVSQTPQVWIDHQALQLEGALVLAWDYAVGLFPTGLIDKLFETYVAFVRALATHDQVWDEPREPRSQPMDASAPQTHPHVEDGSQAQHEIDLSGLPEDLIARVVEIVADCLGRPAVDVDARVSLQELGADSLELVRILNRLEHEFGRRPAVDENLLGSAIAALVRSVVPDEVSP